MVSFAALGFLWRESRLGVGLDDARPLPRFLQWRVPQWVWRAVGLVATAYFLIGFFGPDDADNPTAGVVYVLFWVGLVPLSLLFGGVWRLFNPLRTVVLLVRGSGHRGRCPRRWATGRPPPGSSPSSGWSWSPPGA